jgi:hypothetical protein
MSRVTPSICAMSFWVISISVPCGRSKLSNNQRHSGLASESASTAREEAYPRDVLSRVATGIDCKGSPTRESTVKKVGWDFEWPASVSSRH